MSQVVILDGGEKKMSWDKLCEKKHIQILANDLLYLTFFFYSVFIQL